MAPELVELLDPKAGTDALDCTFGAGGHARLVAERIGADGSLVCVDRDSEAERRFDEMRDELGPGARFVRADFADAIDELAEAGERMDVAYMDLGLSSPQVDTLERGFSYAADAPLDMRMDPDQELSAREVVNDWPTDRLAGILRSYGEERHSRSIAAEIARRRPIETTFELVEAVRDAVPPSYRFGRGHPAKKTFQAIRIAVNGELDSLDRGAPGRLGAAARGRSPRRDLVPLARGPARQALPRRARPRVHLPAGAPAVRLLAPARGGAHHPPCRGRLARGGRTQPPLALCPPARRAQAPGSA